MQQRGRWRRQGRVIVVRRAVPQGERTNPMTTQYSDGGQVSASVPSTDRYNDVHGADVVRTDSYRADTFGGEGNPAQLLVSWNSFDATTHYTAVPPTFQGVEGRGIRAALRGRGMV